MRLARQLDSIKSNETSASTGETSSMMINAEPLKHYLEAVERAKQARQAVAAAYDAAPVGERGQFAEQFQQAERVYLAACEQLASAVACEVNATEAQRARPWDRRERNTI